MAETLTIRTASSTEVVKIAVPGPQGPAGQGVPVGGSTGQVLRKVSGTDYDTEWAAAGSSSGSVTSVALASTDLTISGSPITDSGTITANLGTTGVAAGTYTKVTVDEKGRVTTGTAATASDVGAANEQLSESLTLTSSTTLQSARNKLWKINNNTFNNVYVELPTEGIQVGDIVEIEFYTSTGRVLEIRRDGAAFGASINNSKRKQYRAESVLPSGWAAVPDVVIDSSSIYAAGGDVLLGRIGNAGNITLITATAAARNLLDDVDSAAQRITLGLGDAAIADSTDFAAASHTHAASDITSGTIAHERGGLEADVSAYNGLVKISGGSTSAVTVTSAGEALLDDADAAAQRTTLGLGTAATAATGDFAAASHSHELTALAATGATNGHVLTANGSNGATFAALPASGVSSVSSSASDVLGVSGANITGVDAGAADRLVFWDDSASKLTYLEAGSGLSISGTTLSATGGGVTTGSVDNAILRADGTGGSTSQSSDINIEDASTTTQNNVAITNQHSGQTNSALVLTPKGTGAFILGPRPTGASSTGNARGASAVDLQISRTAATRVASGDESVICGGSNNTASGFQSAIWGGRSNLATSDRSMAAGDGNTSSNNNSIALGQSNTSSGAAAFATGLFNTASGSYACAIGVRSAADRYAIFAHSSGQFGATGDSQRFRAVLRNKTTTNSAVELFLDGSSTRLTVPSGKVMAMLINITGSKSDGSAVAHYVRQYAIKNVGGTTSEVYAPVTIGTDNAASTSIAVEANDTNDALRINVTGITSETWRWVASVDAVEVAYGT